MYTLLPPTLVWKQLKRRLNWAQCLKLDIVNSFLTFSIHFNFNRELCPGEEGIISDCVWKHGKRILPEDLRMDMTELLVPSKWGGGSPNWTENLILENKMENKIPLFWLFLHSHAHSKHLELPSSSVGCKMLGTAFDIHSTIHKFIITSKFTGVQVKKKSHSHELILHYMPQIVPRKSFATMKIRVFIEVLHDSSSKPRNVALYSPVSRSLLYL